MSQTEPQTGATTAPGNRVHAGGERLVDLAKDAGISPGEFSRMVMELATSLAAQSMTDKGQPYLRLAFEDEFGPILVTYERPARQDKTVKVDQPAEQQIIHLP